MKVLLTGSTGMIGKAILAKLPKKYTVIEASRSKGIDITHKEQVEKAMKGVSIVIHAAAQIDETSGYNELRAVNVEGTQNLLDCADHEGIERFIYVSSTGVYGNTTTQLDENSPQEPLTAYEKTKKEAEERVWNMQEVFPVTIIRPPLVIGPNSYWANIFKTIKKGFPLIGKGKNAWQMVDVDDLADFIVKSVEDKKMENEIFLVAEKETHTLREVVDMIADIQHVKRVKTIPKPVGILLSHVFGIQSKLTGKKSLLIPAHVKRLFKHREYKIEKALATGWKPKYSTREALEKTYNQLQKKN